MREYSRIKTHSGSSSSPTPTSSSSIAASSIPTPSASASVIPGTASTQTATSTVGSVASKIMATGKSVSASDVIANTIKNTICRGKD